MSKTKGVIIGVDPHKMSVTIEVVDTHERLLGSGRFETTNAGYAAMQRYVKQWPDRLWAVEGANGAGGPLAQRLVAAGEQVVDVPAKLAARVRLFDTGHNRKTDALDAHSIAVVAVRTEGLRMLVEDGELEALRMLTDRRDELARPPTSPDRQPATTTPQRTTAWPAQTRPVRRPGQGDARHRATP